METIFIDTSIFEANNFLESKRIQEVYKLAERGDIKVVIPRLTYDEILNRILKNIEEASQKFKKYREDTRVLRNVPSLSKKFEPFDSDKIKEELYKNLNERFSKSKFEIIDYPTLNIEGIFKSYFEKKFPFGNGSKKNEFPDAFALKTIELWAESKGIKIKAFSKDNDMLNYKSENIEIIEDFEFYLSNKIKDIEGVKHKRILDQIDNIIKFQSENIKEDIKNWLEVQLEDDSKYYDYSNYYEIHEVSIIKILVEIDDYGITNVSEDFISVELKVSLKYEVEIIIDDDDYMYKDDDTKEWVFLETKPILINEVRYIDVDLIFDIEAEDDTLYEPEIETINGGRNLNI
jgi:hypothetical protein